MEFPTEYVCIECGGTFTTMTDTEDQCPICHNWECTYEVTDEGVAEIVENMNKESEKHFSFATRDMPSFKGTHVKLKDYMIKDSGSRSEFETGAVRDGQTGKGRMDLLPPFALIALAKVYEAGCQKYGDRNWEKGIPLSRYMDSGLRHIVKFMMGLEDEQHLHMAAWNIMCAIDTLKRIEIGIVPETLNDLPYPVRDLEEEKLGEYLG